LKKLFEEVGEVRSVMVGRNYHTGRSKGYGFVVMETRKDAEAAFTKFDGFEIDRCKLRLDWDAGLPLKEKSGNNSSPRRESPRRDSPKRD